MRLVSVRSIDDGAQPDGPQPLDTAERLELKFALPNERIEYIAALLRHHTRRDPDYPAGIINSIYFDSPTFAAFEDALNGEHTKFKVRLRWYGETPAEGKLNAYLEIKSKVGFTGKKRRMQVSLEGFQTSGDPANLMGRFQVIPKLMNMGLSVDAYLQPVIFISYRRRRFRSQGNRPARITLDDRIRSCLVGPSAAAGRGWVTLEGAALEIKGTSMDTPDFLGDVGRAATPWRSFSKYANCLLTHLEPAGSYGWRRPF